jgi:hypothetical protein
VERDRRAFPLDEQLGRSAKDLGYAVREPFGGLERRLMTGLEGDGQSFGPASARVCAALQSMVPEILDPADAYARGHVRHGSPGQDSDGQPLGSRRRDRGQAA